MRHSFSSTRYGWISDLFITNDGGVVVTVQVKRAYDAPEWIVARKSAPSPSSVPVKPLNKPLGAISVNNKEAKQSLAAPPAGVQDP